MADGLAIGTVTARRRGTMIALALAAIAIWAGTPAVTKLAVGALDALAVGALRTLIAAAVALPLVFLAGLRPPRSPAGRVFLAVSGISGFALFPVLFSFGVARTSAGHSALILAVLPIFTGFIAALLERRRPVGRWWAGAAIALVGTYLLVDARFGLAGAGATLEGDLIVLLSCIFASSGYVAGARAAREVSAWAVSLWGLIIGALVLLPLVALSVPLAPFLDAGWPVWTALFYLAVIVSIVGYAAWYRALALDDIGRTGLLQFVQPLFSVVIAVLLLGETVTWSMALSGLVILFGVALVQFRRRL
ncbi:MAG: DMT family transporter [Kiloniellales bacterium]|nr:DMT family transporter [Kiloniellales bacterium]